MANVSNPTPEEAEVIARVLEKMQLAFAREDSRFVVIALCTMLPHYAEDLQTDEMTVINELRIAYEYHRAHKMIAEQSKGKA